MALREKNVLRQAETGSDQRSPISESIDDGLPALAPGQPILQRYAVCFNSERVPRRPPRPASAESRTRAEVGSGTGVIEPEVTMLSVEAVPRQIRQMN